MRSGETGVLYFSVRVEAEERSTHRGVLALSALSIHPEASRHTHFGRESYVVFVCVIVDVSTCLYVGSEVRVSSECLSSLPP